MEERLRELLKIAIKEGVSDIHFLNRNNETSIEMRRGSDFIKVERSNQDERLIRYLQYLANLDIGSPLKPDTGSFEFVVDGELIPLRFSYINNLKSISCVLRLLNVSKQIDVNNLSHISSQNEIFKNIINKRNGLVLFSGPTGSGKTTTLYSILRSVKNKVIFSLEDPIELFQDNIIQMSINESIGFTYKEGIKQILRHDPDIIMIGEIRDENAAQMAIRAANTGHLVLSSIHSSSAKSTITRMKELGVKEDNLYENLVLLSNQILIEDKDSKKLVIYEIMDEEEINYYRINHHNSSNFISIDKQIQEGKKNATL